MSDLITIDGSLGEGGGQVLRTALALSLATGRPFQIDRIRAGRPKPGLLRQHLTAVNAAVEVGRGRVGGAELGSCSVRFAPSAVHGGEYRLAVGTAGSATLVLQAVLPALILASTPSRLTLEGGTHNPYAPPFDFLQRSLLPQLERMGARVTAELLSYGFYPAGGGRFSAAIEPCPRLTPIALLERGPVSMSARALVSAISPSIAARELKVVNHRLGLDWPVLVAESVPSPVGPGNVLMIAIASRDVTEVITGFGEKGVGAAAVAEAACAEARQYLAAEVPVGRHLADQLLVPMVLAGGGTFRTLTPTRHTTTNIDVIRQFLEVPIAVTEEAAGVHRVTVGTPIKAGE